MKKYLIILSFLIIGCEKFKVDPDVTTTFVYQSGSININYITLNNSYYKSPTNLDIAIVYNDGSQLFNSTLTYVNNDNQNYNYTVKLKGNNIVTASIQYDVNGVIKDVIIGNNIFVKK